MSDFRIREPLRHEAAAIADVHIETWRQTYSGIFSENMWDATARERRLTMWQAICSSSRSDWTTAVADRNDVIVGFAHAASSTEEDAPCERVLWCIYLLAEAHGCGAGQQLMNTVVGDGSAYLWVLESNERARAFYTKNGFTPDGAARPIEFAPGHNEIRMVRR